VEQFDLRTIIEWRAGNIQDPIERLRYLRQVGRYAWPGLGTFLPKRFLAVAAVVGLSLALASAYTVFRVIPPQVRPVILAPQLPSSTSTPLPGSVWLVDQRGEAEIYSNGLRVENRFAISNIPRESYEVFEPAHADVLHGHWKAGPAGIVYHTTESDLAPFEEDHNRTLQRISVEVLNFVRRNHSYHFVIDRFGRVFRIVKEEDIAFHAGHSVWSDGKWVYVHLNTSFLGIAFETQTQHDCDQPSATPAQIDAARVLTEMLRSKYQIDAANCVTHAQVSVNPSNLLIGYHTDWADKFPFTEIGLSDNYSKPAASLAFFGFDYDPVFVQSTGARLQPGLLLGETQFRARAAKLQIPAPQYRSMLQRNFREIMAAAKPGDTAKETAHEQP
jgi:hypothetical protein